VKSTDSQPAQSAEPEERARIAIDLGAENCRVSLLRWRDGQPAIELIHRIPNGPVHVDGSLRWPFDTILSGLEDGLRTAAQTAPEGIASIAVDGWAVDYVRLGADGRPLANPFCYRDERTIAAKKAGDSVVAPEEMFLKTGAQPLRINTVYQLLADSAANSQAPWINLPEYVLYKLGGRRVAEFTNATHSGLVDIDSGQWSEDLLRRLKLSKDTLPPIVRTGTAIGRLKGGLAELDAFRDTELIVPACHDTASAIAGVSSPLEKTAYICSGTWSLVGTLIEEPIITDEAMRAGFTNQGAACGGFCFHTNVNGMWILKQCLESWRKAGRPWTIETLIAEAEHCGDCPGVIPVDAPSLLLDDNMPARLNEQLRACGFAAIDDCTGNEPVFARMIFESLAAKYAAALSSLEQLLGTKLERIHILGGGALNQLLTKLTAQRTGLPVETGNVESSTVGNFAVQLASTEAPGKPLRAEDVRKWARQLSTVECWSEKQVSIVSGRPSH
jgi:rhamnulokinase